MNENNSWMMEEMARIKREEWLHSAELYRMEKIALSGLPRQPGLVDLLLYQVGRRLAAWGERLEARYCAAIALTPATNGDGCR